MPNVDIQTVTSVLGIGSGIILFGVTTFYTDFYNKPNVHILVSPDEIDTRLATIEVTNTGRNPATDLRLSIEAPKELVSYAVSHSENVTIAEHKGASLVLVIPRLAYGDGSFVRIYTMIKAEPNTSLTNYTTYATYNEGSTKGTLTLSYEQFISFISQISIQILISVAFAALVYSLIRYWLRNRIKEEKFRQNIKNMIDARSNLQKERLTYDKTIPEIEYPPEFIFYPKDFDRIETCNNRLRERNNYINEGNVKPEGLISHNQRCLEGVIGVLENIDWTRYKDLIKQK